MLRTVSRRLAKAKSAVATAPALTNEQILASQKVSMFLGGSNLRFGSIQNYSDVLKGGATGASKVAAQLGRAYALLNAGKPELALVDIEAASTDCGKKTDFAKLASMSAVLRAACASAMLEDVAMDSEMKISEMREVVKAAYKLAVEQCPGNFGVALSAAEFYLSVGDNTSAMSMLDIAESAVNKNRSFILTTGESSEAFSTETKFVSLASRVESIANSPAMKANSVNKILDSLSQDEEATSLLAALRQKYSLKDVTDTEVVAVSSVIAAAEGDNHFFDFFSEDATYKNSGNVSEKITVSIQDGGVESNKLGELTDLIDAKADFCVTPKELQKVIDNSKSTDLLDDIQAAFGDKALPDVTASGSAYTTAMGMIEGASPSNLCCQSAASDANIGLLGDLSHQIVYRIQIDRALAMQSTGKAREALEIVQKVLTKGDYIHLWKAISLSGRLNRELGKVDASDADFKKLFSYKKAHPGRDVPAFDENRNKSTF